VAAVAGVVMVAADIPLGVWRMEGAVEVIYNLKRSVFHSFVGPHVSHPFKFIHKILKFIHPQDPFPKIEIKTKANKLETF
jgi:hypothetical protein